MKITDDIFYVGVDDKEIDLFEGQFKVENGMSYNSYVFLDEKTAVFDSVDERFGKDWLDNVEKVLDGKSPDYLVVSHMEPDHSGSITAFTKKYPNAKIVSNEKSFVYMKQFFGFDYSERKIVVSDGSELNLGKHLISFYSAPMVHWPEVMVSYDNFTNTLFSADAFGKFGALDTDEEWDCEARRYYFGIVGKYGTMVQNLLKKISSLKIERICPLHGPIIEDSVERCVKLYDVWSSYGAESQGVFIAYTSVYGHTAVAVKKLADALKTYGAPKVSVCDLAREDMAEAVEDAFRYGTVVFATTTYNGSIFPFMNEFITHLTERNFSNKKIAFIENGTWAPVAEKCMRKMLEKCKNLSVCNTVVTIKSALAEENVGQIDSLAKELCADFITSSF